MENKALGCILSSEGISDMIRKHEGDKMVSLFKDQEGKAVALDGNYKGLYGIFYNFNGNRQVPKGVQYVYINGSNGEIVFPTGVYYIAVEHSDVQIEVPSDSLVMLYTYSNSKVELISSGKNNRISICGAGEVVLNMEEELNNIKIR